MCFTGCTTDFAQAHGLSCDYPASPPAVGDYLEVADTLPAPAAGRGYWYLTAATYQGQARIGRKTSGETLSGRNPGEIPACVETRIAGAISEQRQCR